jgi:cell division protein FtsB
MIWPIIFILVLLIPILAIVLDSQLGRALAQRLERGRLDEPDRHLAERLGYLENEVDRLNGEVQRLTEESDFLHKLLAERAGDDDDGSPPASLPEGERPG